MLFGKLIFIKKTGGDGSRFPVTERKITIGRSDECLIRIHIPQVAQLHCQLIVDDNGQVKLKNMSNHTFLNGKPVNLGEFILRHGDIIKIGGRMARWEYSPTSKYCQQGVSSPGRLVAVVKPQRRSLDASLLKESMSHLSLLKTPVGVKRRHSERPTSEGGSKALKVQSTNKIRNSVSNVAMLTSMQNLESSKVMFDSKSKGRKFNSEVSDLNVTLPTTPTSVSRKSVSPSWRVKIVTSPSNTKGIKRKSTPIKKLLPSDKSTSRHSGLLKASVLNAIIEDSPKDADSGKRRTSKVAESPVHHHIKNATPDLNATPKSKAIQSKRLVESEKKLKIARTSLPAKSPKISRLSLATKPIGKTARINLLKSYARKSLSSPVKEKPAPKALDISKTPQKATKIPNSKTPKSTRKSVSPMRTPSVNKNSTNDLIVFSTPKPASSKKIDTPTTRTSPKQTPFSSRRRLSKSPGPQKTPRTPKRRSINTSDSLAQKAATKLKTINPRKPDKNKKAALLVLGKATRKQSTSNNLKTLLKNKIVKKAIKQSTIAGAQTSRKVNVVKGQTKKVPKKLKALKNKKQSIGVKEKETDTAKKSPSASPDKSPDVKRAKTSEETPRSVNKSPEKNAVAVSAKKLSIQTQDNPLTPDQFLLSQIPDGYLLASNRRSSKRLSSKNDVGKPEYMELSPTALGLIPKNIDEIFKTPRGKKKRRSISLVTPKTSSTVGIIKSASTNKKLSRKSVRFSSGNLSITHDGTQSGTPFNFENVVTPDISLDVFVSPLSDSVRQIGAGDTGSAKKQLSVLKASATKENLLAMESPKSDLKKTKCARRLLQSPDSKSIASPMGSATKRTADKQSPTSASKRSKTMSPSAEGKDKAGSTTALTTPLKGSPKSQDTKVMGSLRRRSAEIEKSEAKSPHVKESPKKESASLGGTNELSRARRAQRSPKNDLSDVKGVKRLLATPKPQKSPRNDLSDVKGVKELLATPQPKRSPRNDLSDLRGVKKLLATPKVQKGPKNDLSDIRGVKKLLATPRIQKDPKNDLSDVRGVKKLLATPRVQKDPKNDLSDVRGVKKLLATPKPQKSPKNDLSDVKGVKKLLATPKTQKEPKNDLSDLRGVKRLLGSPKTQKSPKNNLSDLRGVKQLLGTPKIQRSPRNDLSDVRGVKTLLATPKIQKDPKNELEDLRGVKKLLSSPKVQKSPKNDLTNVEGVKQLLKTPRVQRSPRNDLTDVEGVKELYQSAVKVRKSSDSKRGVSNVNELLISTTSTDPEGDDALKDVKRRRATYSKSKSPKNDLTDKSKVRALFDGHKPINDLNLSFTGVAELFDLNAKEDAKTPVEKSRSTRARTMTRARKSEAVDVSSADDGETTTRRRTRTAVGKPQKIAKTSKKEEDTEGKETTEKKVARKTKTEDVEVTISPVAQRQTTRGRKRVASESVDTPKGIRSKRVKNTAESQTEASPPKLRRKQGNEEKVATKRGTRSTKAKTTKADETSLKNKETTTAGRKGKAAEKEKVASSKKSTLTTRGRSKSVKASPEAKSKGKGSTSREKVAEKDGTAAVKMSLRKTRSAAKH